MSVRSALLTLLSQGPRHGYQLKAEFDIATGEAWPLNYGQVYTTLQRLERDGLIAAQGDPDDDGRVAYGLTNDGQSELATWLESPVVQQLASRDEASLKVLLVVATGAHPVGEVIKTQRAAIMSNLQALTSMKADARQDDDPDAVAWGLHLDRMVMLAEAEVRWLDLTEERLRARRPKTLSERSDVVAPGTSTSDQTGATR